MRETGVVKFFSTSKGFGFIQREHGGDVFVHRSELERAGIQDLPKGAVVEFRVIESEKGLRAENLAVIDKD